MSRRSLRCIGALICLYAPAFGQTTGRAAKFDFADIHRSADPSGAVSLPDAMERQLGLKLETVKRPLPVLVVDRIGQRPTEN